MQNTPKPPLINRAHPDPKALKELGVECLLPSEAPKTYTDHLGRGTDLEVRALRIALVEDDPAQAELLQTWLAGAGHDCHCFGSAGAFLHAIRHDSFDLTILDWGLPDMPGDQVLLRVREHLDWRMPILFITSRDQEEDVVYALEHGADDYMAKPVKQAETLARVGALGRRAHAHSGSKDVLVCEPYRLDATRREVKRAGIQVELTQKELELTMFLFRNAGRLLSRGHILESVWGTRPDLNTRTVDTHISRIRSKLGISPEVGWRLGAVYQHGYRLERVLAHGDTN